MKKYEINFEKNHLQSLHEILSRAFSYSFKEFETRYNFLIDCYTSEACSPEKIFYRDQKKYYNPQESQLSEIYKKSTLIGIDFPIFLKSGKSKNNILIIGEDPLRNSDDFNSDGTYIGTPYAYHSICHRNYLTKIYSRIFDFLLTEGYNIYLTDIFKIWVQDEVATSNSDNNKTIKARIGRKDREVFKDILHEEINKFEPKYIITFGKNAEKMIEQIDKKHNLNLKIIPFFHPSGTANGPWKITLKGKKATNENKLEFICNELEQKLK